MWSHTLSYKWLTIYHLLFSFLPVITFLLRHALDKHVIKLFSMATKIGTNVFLYYFSGGLPEKYNAVVINSDRSSNDSLIVLDVEEA